MQIEHFADCVLNKKPLELPPSDAVRNVAFIEALKRSTDSASPVGVEA